MRVDGHVERDDLQEERGRVQGRVGAGEEEEQTALEEAVQGGCGTGSVRDEDLEDVLAEGGEEAVENLASLQRQRGRATERPTSRTL